MKRSSNCSCNNITIFLLQLLWDYYNSNTVRSRSGRAIDFRARARILDGRKAIYTGQAPVVASYSSRGPDVNNALLETGDVLKPNIMAPGSSIWAAWSPKSEGDKFIKGIDANILVILWTNMCFETERFNICCKLLFVVQNWFLVLNLYSSSRSKFCSTVWNKHGYTAYCWYCSSDQAKAPRLESICHYICNDDYC